MAGRAFVCRNCKRATIAWEDGNPYYIDANGFKRHAYHPSPERALCTGNDTPGRGCAMRLDSTS